MKKFIFMLLGAMLLTAYSLAAPPGQAAPSYQGQFVHAQDLQFDVTSINVAQLQTFYADDNVVQYCFYSLPFETAQESNLMPLYGLPDIRGWSFALQSNADKRYFNAPNKTIGKALRIRYSIEFNRHPVIDKIACKSNRCRAVTMTA